MSKEIPAHLLTAVQHVLQHTASPDERKAVRDWFYADMPETILEVDSAYNEKKVFARILRKLKAEIRKDLAHHSGRTLWLPRAAQAAAVLLLVVAGYLLWRSSSSHPSPVSLTPPPVATTILPDADLATGGKKATLLLADGTRIALDSVAPGYSRQEGYSTIQLRSSGQLTYVTNDISDQRTPTTAMTNTLTVPLGGEFRLVLPDGSEVWLNAGSTLRYPSAFTATTRTVQLSGEAYFHIAPRAQQPFHVHTTEADILALGTRFNVNTYQQGFTRATLAQGRIQVSRQATPHSLPATPVILRPGEQAEVGPASHIAVTEKNTSEATAWKDGEFLFTGNTLPEVMDQLSRWYTLTVEYPTPVPPMQLVGSFSRQYTLKQALAWLARMGVHYRQQGHHIQLLP